MGGFHANVQGNQGLDYQQDNYYDISCYNKCDKGNKKNKNEKIVYMYY